MHEEMEHLTTQFVDQGISFPHEAEGGIEKSANVQRSMQRLKVNWIGLKLSPPHLLGMLEGKRVEEEEEQWEDIEGKVGFYGQHEQITSEAWDAREATRAIKDEEMEHLTTQSANQGISFPHEDEGGIKKSVKVQALHAEVEGQLDWPQTKSPTTIRHARMQKRRRRVGAVGRDRHEGRII